MSIVTISRGSFSGGKCLAECLARKLGYRCVDRDVIVERAAAYGVSQEELLDALQKPPSLLGRFQHRKYTYLAMIQAALAEEVMEGSAVYHGNAGHLLLKGCPSVLRVRIIVPMEKRVRMAEERLKFTREEALGYIDQVDQERRKWTHYLYGVDWGDPSLYDLVLNLEHLEIGDACEVLASMLSQPGFQFTPERRTRMEEFVLASRIRASIAIHPSTAHLEVDVELREAVVHVFGKTGDSVAAEALRRIARDAPGVIDVKLEGNVSSRA